MLKIMKRFNPWRFISIIRGRRLSTVENVLVSVAMVGIMVMMILTTADVTGRYLFNSPVKGSIEIVEMVIAIIVFLSLPASQRQNIQVGSDFLVSRLKRRRYHILRFFNLLVPLLFFAIVTVWSAEAALEAYEHSYRTYGILRFPTAPFQFTLTVGSFLLCLRFIAQIRHEFSGIVRGKT